MFWDNTTLRMFLLDSSERLSMLCAKVPKALPSAQLALQTNMEKHHPIFDLHNKAYGKKH